MKQENNVLNVAEIRNLITNSTIFPKYLGLYKKGLGMHWVNIQGRTKGKIIEKIRKEIYHNAKRRN